MKKMEELIELWKNRKTAEERLRFAVKHSINDDVNIDDIVEELGGRIGELAYINDVEDFEMYNTVVKKFDYGNRVGFGSGIKIKSKTEKKELGRFLIWLKNRIEKLERLKDLLKKENKKLEERIETFLNGVVDNDKEIEIVECAFCAGTGEKSFSGEECGRCGGRGKIVHTKEKEEKNE